MVKCLLNLELAHSPPRGINRSGQSVSFKVKHCFGSMGWDSTLQGETNNPCFLCSRYHLIKVDHVNKVRDIIHVATSVLSFASSVENDFMLNFLVKKHKHIHVPANNSD